MTEREQFLSRFMIGATHPSLAGHFPGRPIVPGVVVLEEVQNAIAARWPERVVQAWPQVKFITPLLPGEWAAIELSVIDEHQFDFRVVRADAVIAQGRLRT